MLKSKVKYLIFQKERKKRLDQFSKNIASLKDILSLLCGTIFSKIGQAVQDLLRSEIGDL